MQRHGPRHFTAYAITTVVYLLVVAFVYYIQSEHFVSSEKPKESVMKMSLSQFVPEVVVPPEPIVKETEEPVVEEAVKEPEVEPKPVVEKEVVQEVLPKPIVEKVTPKVVEKPVKKKPIPKKVEKKKIKKKIKKTKKKKRKHKKTSQKHASKQQHHSTKAEKNKFWNALRRKIDKHKFYPRIAKKRGMEGVVKVKFTVLANGHVGNILVDGPKVFHHSAKNAVKSAFPLNVKNIPIALPASINITLRYLMR